MLFQDVRATKHGSLAHDVTVIHRSDWRIPQCYIASATVHRPVVKAAPHLVPETPIVRVRRAIGVVLGRLLDARDETTTNARGAHVIDTACLCPASVILLLIGRFAVQTCKRPSNQRDANTYDSSEDQPCHNFSDNQVRWSTDPRQWCRDHRSRINGGKHRLEVRARMVKKSLNERSSHRSAMITVGYVPRLVCAPLNLNEIELKGFVGSKDTAPRHDVNACCLPRFTADDHVAVLHPRRPARNSVVNGRCILIEVPHVILLRCLCGTLHLDHGHTEDAVSDLTSQ